MQHDQLIEFIYNGGIDATLLSLYGENALDMQKQRYATAVDRFVSIYGDRDMSIFSVSGRSELSGNHTDHNRGCVIATAVDLDIIAIASPTPDSIVRVSSEGHNENYVDINEFTSPRAEFYGKSTSIVAGMCATMRERGYATGGFVAYTTSSVPTGSGLSSSAAYEDMIGTIISHFYNYGQISNIEIAKMAQYAENVFFGKPCGLMDQMACAVGGIIAIDFADPSYPDVEPIEYDFADAGYNLCIINTGGNHADLTDDYASVPAEMKAVAARFGQSALREVNEQNLICSIPALRASVGDRAILRSLHFFEENKRVAVQKQALLDGNLELFFDNVKASGNSSFCYLQNVYTAKNLTEQGLSLALCLCNILLGDKMAAWRVHGGGFAGTVQAFVHSDDVKNFKAVIDSVFGVGACLVLRPRTVGAQRIL